MNLFATVLTYPAPSANYRGESEENRTVIQKITYGRFEYSVISPEAIRNALRETLATYGLKCNRSRLDDEEQLAVKFQDYPDPDTYADDFFFGYLVAASGADRKKIQEALKKNGRSVDDFKFKRDSVFRMNLARAVEPYRNNAIFTQSPLTSADSPWQNAKTSALLHRETSLTAFQYPFALNLEDCKGKGDWTKALLRAIGELNDVAGNHARSYYEMAPASIVLRLSNQLVAGYDTYGFDAQGSYPEVIEGIILGDYPGEEFHFGGKIVKDMAPEKIKQLEAKKVTLHRDPRQLLAAVVRPGFPNAEEMTVLWIYLQAPFAAFRPFTAGWYRPTAGFLSPSAAYGLMLNIAGIESRRDDGLSPMTVTQFDLPPARIALGAVPSGARADPFPSIQSLYQQLHNYPVGASGKERKEDAKGNKYNITPVRRQLLVDVRACIGLDTAPELEQRVRDGLRGAHPRYGLPFLGDNAFLIDRLESRDNPPPAHWYRRIGEHDEDGIAPKTTRLTIWIDRQDMSKTLSALYAPDPHPTDGVPGKDYWTSINPPSAPPAPAKKAKSK